MFSSLSMSYRCSVSYEASKWKSIDVSGSHFLFKYSRFDVSYNKQDGCGCMEVSTLGPETYQTSVANLNVNSVKRSLQAIRSNITKKKE